MEPEILPIQLNFDPKNREQRHALKNEYKRHIPRLFKVEQSFLNEIFGEEEFDYDFLYTKHLEWHNKLVASMKFKYTTPRPNYFQEKYGAESKVKCDKFYHNFNETLRKWKIH